MNPRLLPYSMIILSGLAAIVYYCCGDLRRGTYWAAAAVLNITVTL